MDSIIVDVSLVRKFYFTEVSTRPCPNSIARYSTVEYSNLQVSLQSTVISAVNMSLLAWLSRLARNQSMLDVLIIGTNCFGIGMPVDKPSV